MIVFVFLIDLTCFYLMQSAATPQPDEEGMKLKAVIGYNGNGRGNMVWSPDQGLYNIFSLKNNLNICQVYEVKCICLDVVVK